MSPPFRKWAVGVAAAVFLSGALADEWPMLRGNPQHTGLAAGRISRPTHVSWVREIHNERLGPAMEPIVSGGKVLVGTHSGSIYALSAESGESVWQFRANGPFLHSPGAANGLVFVASIDGCVYGLSLGSGKLAWQFELGRGGASAAPVIASNVVFIGSRAGLFVALNARDGKPLWQREIGVSIRQTAAVDEDRVYFVAEDLRARCLDAGSGAEVWVSGQFPGQTARDYYPILIRSGGRKLMVFRTNPVLNMGQRIGRDRTMLCRSAGVDDSSWQKLDSWIKSDQARGTPELWAKEQEAIRSYLETDPDARSFFVLDAATGKEAMTPPVLWIAGCQGVGAQPALTADGKLLVFYRSAYGNWNHGVAPLVALGLWNPEDNRITPLFHQQGRQPQWNCFWGTADESQNFLMAGTTALIIHQGTLSGFDLEKSELFPIAGERDTYGGYKNPGWARNEWHGPERSGVALANDRVYWQTGSRILCLAPGQRGSESQRPSPVAIGKPALVESAPAQPAVGTNELRKWLAAGVREVLSTNWAPLFTDPGLAGRVFSFDHSADFFAALSWAYPHLDSDLASLVRARLRDEWRSRPPFERAGAYDLKAGAPRELFNVPVTMRERLGTDKAPHPFGGLHAVSLYARRCDEQAVVTSEWAKIRASYEDFSQTKWQLDGGKGDLFANRYLTSLMLVSQLARRVGDTPVAHDAEARARATREQLVAWWRRAAGQGTLRTFTGASELDPFIGKGGGFLLALAPHRHGLALFKDLSPDLANFVHESSGGAVDTLWADFSSLCPTWALTAEERQIHFGENFVDPPEFGLSGFLAAAWFGQNSGRGLAGQVDLPFCRADLYYITRLAVALDAK